MRLKLRWCMIHHNEILEQTGNLHGVPFSELSDLELPVQKSLVEIATGEKIRVEDDLPEVWHSTECGKRREPLMEEPKHLETVVLSLRHENLVKAATLKC